MSFRRLVLGVLSASILAACSDDIAEPGTDSPAVIYAINPAATCTGATMPVNECEALVALYNTTNGPDWTSAVGWGTDPNPCHWEGVRCSTPDVGWVERLDRWAKNLTGPIPAERGASPDGHARLHRMRS